MSVTLNSIFGTEPTSERATPGSYGQPPRGYRLPDATRLGRVQLQIADLTRSLAFYQDTLGLRIVQRDATRVTLAAHDDAQVILELVERAGARRATRGLLGLYHVAILLPDRASLGRFIRHLADIGVRAGAGDHLVSEAFYLTDPDGLGIEVYADRPRESWTRIDRELMLATDSVDVRSVIDAAGDTLWTGMPAGTVIGHVHLHVGDLERASAFYADALGFDRMTWRYPGALFLGAGGYHHHVGTNTWAGPTAQTPDDDVARLLAWTIELPTGEDVVGAAHSLRSAGHPVDDVGADAVRAHDPWGTAIMLRATSTGSDH